MKTFRNTFNALSLLIIILFSVSCSKDLNLIGLGLVSPEDLLKAGYVDSVQMYAYSIGEDSVKTANLNYALIGSMNDPVFGRTTANWFSQLRLSVEPTDFGTSPVFDSAFLLLPYYSSYGDTISNMTLKVYHVTEDIVDSVHQYSNHSVSYDQGNLLGQLTFSPRPHDSAYFDGKKQAPILRIPITSDFGQLVFTDTSNLTDNDAFLAYFKGIAIVAEPQASQDKGAIIKMTISAGYSKIKMYYHNSTDTSTYSFSFDSDCNRFNQYNHENYAGASPYLTSEIIENDTTLGDQFVFLQTMGGVRVKFKFPYLDQFRVNGKEVLINDAQLIFHNALPSDNFTAPSSLFLYPVADDGTLYPYQLPDADEGTAYFDGTYDKTTGRYRFRISRYVQQVISGKRNNNGLFMVIPGSSVIGGRIVLNGPKAASEGMKLYIKYTIVN